MYEYVIVCTWKYSFWYYFFQGWGWDYPPSWQNGLVRTFKKHWVFMTKAMQELAQTLGGRQLSWIIFCRRVHTSIYQYVLACTDQWWYLVFILQEHVVDGSLTTFGCVEWESELFRGVMRARCYPFKLPKRRFHGMNPQVRYITYKYVPEHTSTYCYVRVCTCSYWYLLLVVVFTFWFLCWGAGVCAGHHYSGPTLSLQHSRRYRGQMERDQMKCSVPCTSTYLYILVCTSMYLE